MIYEARRRESVEANRYMRRGEYVLGVQTSKDGAAYVITPYGAKAPIQIGDWAVQSWDGLGYYPMSHAEFELRYVVRRCG